VKSRDYLNKKNYSAPSEKTQAKSAFHELRIKKTLLVSMRLRKATNHV